MPTEPDWETFHADGLFVRALGPVDAPPIVLVHGLAISSRSMAALAPLLATDHRVVAPDLPGFGQSEGGPLSPQDLGDALAAATVAAGARGALGVAVSLGCNWLAEAMARHPGVFRGGVLLGPTCDPTARSGKTHVLRWLTDLPREPLWMAPVLMADARDAGPKVLRRAFRDMLRHPMGERIAQVQEPVLVARGADDPIVPKWWCERLAALAGGTHVEVPGAGHTLTVNAVAQVAALVRGFEANGLVAPAR